MGGASCRKLYGHKHHLCHSALAFVLRHAHAVLLRTTCAPGCPLTATRGASSHFQRSSIGAIDAPCCPLSGSGIKKNWANSFFVPYYARGLICTTHPTASRVGSWTPCSALVRSIGTYEQAGPTFSYLIAVPLIRSLVCLATDCAVVPVRSDDKPH